MKNLNIPRILLAGDRSSAGKTTISIGLMAVLGSLGYKVQPFKVGLDYIDPSYHTEITGRYSRNLDGYLMSKEGILEVYSHAVEGADIAVIEGVRGLYEGLDGLSDTGSTAQIAKILKAPVILVIDARSITRSTAAIVKGYLEFDKDVNIAGVILNNIGSSRHGEKARIAIETYTGIKVIGEVPREDSIKISMRHLGLIPAIEGRRRVSDFNERLTKIKTIIKENIDIAKLLEIAQRAPHLKGVAPRIFIKKEVRERPKIAVALDEAFNFYYRDNIELLELEGADILYFSPLHDRGLPEVDGLYIGGGYPELFAKELEENRGMRLSIRMASERGLPIYAECGGLMYLTQEMEIRIEGIPEGTYEMAGVIPGKTLMGHTRVVSYNYGQFIQNTPIGRRGDRFIGHEFHHSEIIDLPETTVFAVKLERGTGIKNGYDGILVNNTLALYAHLHGVSYRGFSGNFVESCREYYDKL